MKHMTKKQRAIALAYIRGYWRYSQSNMKTNHKTSMKAKSRRQVQERVIAYQLRWNGSPVWQ
jgi:hypothetical protein